MSMRPTDSGPITIRSDKAGKDRPPEMERQRPMKQEVWRPQAGKETQKGRKRTRHREKENKHAKI